MGDHAYVLVEGSDQPAREAPEAPRGCQVSPRTWAILCLTYELCLGLLMTVGGPLGAYYLEARVGYALSGAGAILALLTCTSMVNCMWFIGQGSVTVIMFVILSMNAHHCDDGDGPQPEECTDALWAIVMLMLFSWVAFFATVRHGLALRAELVAAAATQAAESAAAAAAELKLASLV